MEASTARENVRLGRLSLVTAPSRFGKAMDGLEIRRLERWLLRRALAWFAEPEIAEAIRRLAASGSALGERYLRYQNEVRLLGEAWALSGPRPLEDEQ